MDIFLNLRNGVLYRYQKLLQHEKKIRLELLKVIFIAILAVLTDNVIAKIGLGLIVCIFSISSIESNLWIKIIPPNPTYPYFKETFEYIITVIVAVDQFTTILIIILLIFSTVLIWIILFLFSLLWFILIYPYDVIVSLMYNNHSTNVDSAQVLPTTDDDNIISTSFPKPPSNINVNANATVSGIVSSREEESTMWEFQFSPVGTSGPYQTTTTQQHYYYIQLLLTEARSKPQLFCYLRCIDPIDRSYFIQEMIQILVEHNGTNTERIEKAVKSGGIPLFTWKEIMKHISHVLRNKYVLCVPCTEDGYPLAGGRETIPMFLRYAVVLEEFGNDSCSIYILYTKNHLELIYDFRLIPVVPRAPIDDYYIKWNEIVNGAE